jgi:Na+/melibiose symporter-like transporter
MGVFVLLYIAIVVILLYKIVPRMWTWFPFKGPQRFWWIKHVPPLTAALSFLALSHNSTFFAFVFLCGIPVSYGIGYLVKDQKAK